MRALLDTHVLIWALGQPRRLPKHIQLVLQEQQNEIFFSAASIWEIAIKTQIGRVHFSVQPIEIARAAIDSGFTQLPVFAEVAALVGRLPMHHRDPFDRLLIAQAINQPARLLTADRLLARYSELVTVIEAR